MVACPIACTKRDSSRGEQKSLATYPRAPLPPSTSSTEALRQPAGVATLYSSTGYLDSSAHESAIEPTNFIPSLWLTFCLFSSHSFPLATLQSYEDSDPRAIRDTLVRLASLSRHPRRYPWLESDPCQSDLPSRRRPSRLGRISRYPLDMGHRFESVFES